jgi:hypothetical protein
MMRRATTLAPAMPVNHSEPNFPMTTNGGRPAS